jgi:outer membrane lipoprotein-sorting protein
MKSIRSLITATVVITLGLAATSRVQAEDLKTPQEIMEFVAKKAQGYNSVTAEMKQSINMMGSKMVMNSIVAHKKPTLMRMEMSMPMMGEGARMLMVMGADSIMWQEISMGGQRQIMKIDMNRAKGPDGKVTDAAQKMNPAEQWKETAKVMDFVVLPSEEIDGQAMYVLEGTWNNQAQKIPQYKGMVTMMGKSRMYFGTKDGYMRRMLMYSKDGKTVAMSTEMSNIKFNVEIPDDKFVYVPAEGVNVTDMTGMAGMMQPGGAPAPEPAPEPVPVPVPAPKPVE